MTATESVYVSVSETEVEFEPEIETVSHATFQAPELKEVAALFPNYDVHGLIACGGMGAVYHATQRSLDRGVAIKILPREFSQDEEFRVSFEAEAKAMAKLNHPNLIGVYDFGDVAGLLYIVMEYVPGSSLYAVSHGRALEQDDALKLVIDVCHGLAHAHQYGVLHRDIKPSNILLDDNYSPKIGDFGLASALENQVQEGDQIFGTPGYTAPEVIDPPHTFDQRADIFSVGVMLHELLTGNTPNGEEPLSALPRNANPRLRATIQRAIHPNPEARHASADELAAELEKIRAFPNSLLITSSVTAKAPGPMSRPGALHKSTASSGIGGARPMVLQQSAASSGSRVARPMPRHRMVKKSSSSGAGFLFLLLIAVAAAAYFLVIKPNMEESETVAPPRVRPAPASDTPTSYTPPEIQKPTRRKTVAEEGVKPMDDVDAFFTRAVGIMKDRIRGDLERYRQGLQGNTLDFETQAKQVISQMDDDSAGPLLTELAAAMESWKTQDYAMADALPPALSDIAAIQEIFMKYHAAQLRFRSRFYQKLRSEQAVYITGLQKQIGRYRESNDSVAIRLLEKEIARLGAEPGYYEFLISQ